MSKRLLRPLLYAGATAATGASVLYISYRPRNLPGSDPPVVPPPSFGEDGTIAPPRFPRVKCRDQQIADLRRSSGSRDLAEKAHGVLSGFGVSNATEKSSDSPADDEPYDLLIIGGGATGSGIALDAVTRGLKVAMVDRDDFASGTSSKSTKLVHGGVRYLEKAVWELDYNQYNHCLICSSEAQC